MGKMNELSLAKATPQLPAELETELDNFRKAALDGVRASFLGTLLRFKKGIWVYGDDKRELPSGTKVVALMNEARRGYVRWQDKKAVAHVVGKICEGFAPPPRETLGDNDETRWPIGLSGMREDPWVFTMYLPMKSLDSDDIYTFATSSDGGIQAVYHLIERYSWLGRKHPGEDPIVALNGETYEHPRFGTVHKPKLEIVGWAGRLFIELTDDPSPEPSEGDFGFAEPSPGRDLDDDS